MKVLFASRYVDPNPIGANRNVFLQAKSLKEDFGFDVEILSWPLNDLWTGPIPKQKMQVRPLRVRRDGLTYHIFNAPLDWNEIAGGNVISEEAWEAATNYGMQVLALLKPDIVHLHHRHGIWWLLDSAQRLGIHTVYSNHDWGIACMRTVLVMGDTGLCDGQISANKCARCILQGRGLLGRLNENLVQFKAGRLLVHLLERSMLRRFLTRRGLVRYSAEQRVRINCGRATRVLSQLSQLFTPSKFGRRFFRQLGVRGDRVSVMPWYHDPQVTNKSIKEDQPFTISYIGRISPEKGVHLVFSALKKVRGVPPIQFRIAGATDSAYGRALKERYPEQVGIHAVQWLGWSAVGSVFNTTDVTIIPSVWMDNTPLALIEALAYRVPVIATRIPPIEELVTEGRNAFLASYMAVSSLADAICRALAQKEFIRSGSPTFPVVMTRKKYMALVAERYRSICEPRGTVI